MLAGDALLPLVVSTAISHELEARVVLGQPARGGLGGRHVAELRELMAEVDRLVADGVVANRSEAVRLGLQRLVDQQQRQRVGAAIVDAYRRQPQTDEELAGLDEATRALVNEEPW